ncbi:TIGR00730 family Rossman fold protein [Bacillaceae bacterium SIJ1]|uniref:LOG family protein n=1 Tax=Litoribacterium kuwaitense TaxID=1398745 RepID=UPI0013EA52AE|nr:TIGR00730 family Rossman fold protein [Litoribacterium kuwaitense]NGP44299.1 TIGR00730 family Rossman fold protein [Litoribacterium kuwaitense]
MKRIAVFCGSSEGATSQYKEGATALGKELAKQGITLVYGGASVGLMGTVADAALENGGKVIGVIPQMLEDREISHQHLTEIHVVNTMHERKAKMADLADGFIALPGGPGTLEEFIEIFTWAQLGVHEKPCGLLNINDYYEPLISLFNHMADEQFLHEKYRKMALVDSTPQALIEQMHSYQPPSVKTY